MTRERRKTLMAGLYDLYIKGNSSEDDDLAEDMKLVAQSLRRRYKMTSARSDQLETIWRKWSLCGRTD